MKNPSLLAFITALLIAPEAKAHHLMEFAMPQTLAQGLLSGLGHPILGLDHLAFLLLIGLLSTHLSPKLTHRATIPVVFVATTLIGLALTPLNAPQTLIETLIALSLLVGAASLYYSKGGYGKGDYGKGDGGKGDYGKGDGGKRATKLALATSLLGLFHGIAFGGAIVGAEPTPILGYLVGLTVIQFLTIGLVITATKKLLTYPQTIPACCVAITALGGFFLLT